MSLDPNAVRLANERLWKAHPELKRRLLTNKPEDAALRAEWHGYYKQADAARAPEPAQRPAPDTAPPDTTTPPAQTPPETTNTVVASCPAATTATITDCNDIEKHVKEGDTVLRGQDYDKESNFLAGLSGCPYSHAGIVTRNAAGKLVVVDAYPGRGPNSSDTKAIGQQSVKDFFCDKDHKATQGVIARPKDADAAKKAGKWAYDQIKDPDYTFDLFDPWNKDAKRLYCADFVNQAYESAGLDMVSAPVDFFDAAHKQGTIDAARDFKPILTAPLSDKSVEKLARKKAGESTDFITPCQMVENEHTDKVAEFVPAKTPGSGKSGGR